MFNNYKSAFVRNIVLPLYTTWKKERYLAYYKELNKSQWLPTKEIKQIQLSKLNVLLIHCYNNVPYYRKLFKKLNIYPNGFITETDFQKIPVITKKDIQKNYNDLIAKNYNSKDLIKNATGGSTGEIMNFLQDKNRIDLRKGYVLRHNSWTGWLPGEKIALIWGNDRDVPKKNNIKSKIKSNILDRRLWFNAFDFTEREAINFAKKLVVYNPSIIIGYTTSLYLFYRIIKKNRISIPSPKAIISSAEVLYDNQREFIESVSGSKIFNRYGCREVGLIASECSSHNGLHINSENIFFELVNYNSGMDNNFGEVVVTDLLNYGMPLIRYKIEDLATLSNKQCACGRGLPMIEKIKGRKCDIIQSKDGHLIHGEYFTHLFYSIYPVRMFQLKQKKDFSIIIELEVDGQLSKDELDQLKEKIENKLQSDKITIEIVDKIITPNSGKNRFTISELELEI